jgi:hypothetical protein
MPSKTTGSDVVAPIVHLNGTSRDALIDQLRDAYHALDTAIRAMRAATPHDRDYYISGDPTAGQRARLHHSARVSALESVQDDLVEIVSSIYTQ